MLSARLIPSLLVSYALVAQEPQSAAPQPAAPQPAASQPAAAPKASRRLSLQEAITTSLENNLSVKIAVETREATKSGAMSALGAFDWNLSSELRFSKSESTFQDKMFSIGSTPVSGSSTANTRYLNVGVVKPFEWGGTFNMTYWPSYSSSTTKITGRPDYPSPTPYSGSFSFGYSQSLLSGFGKEAASRDLIIARNSAQAADHDFVKSVIDLVASTEGLYWDVVYAQRNLENKKQALSLAQKQLRENKIRVEVGTMAPIEITSAEAAVAQKDQEIIAAEAQFLNATDALIRSLFPGTERPGSLELTDAPTLSHITLDEAAAERMALERRVELKSTRLGLDSKKVVEAAALNRTKPKLDLTVGYNTNTANYANLSGVNSDITGRDNPGYNVTLNFALPILNSAAKGNLVAARASRRGSELGLKDLELAIGLEVRTASRNVDATEKAVKAAGLTRYFREKNLEAEQRKFENGMSTNFFVLQRQDELDGAKAMELQAQISYAKAVTSLEKAVGNLLEARKLKF